MICKDNIYIIYAKRTWKTNYVVYKLLNLFYKLYLMIKKITWALILMAISLFSFTFAVNSSQGTFWDVDASWWIWVAWTGTNQGEGFLDVVRWFVNWILWILGLIALIVLLWWGFQMVTAAGNEDRYNSWFKILKQAWIWLILIWVSWFIVSLIFSVITAVTWG